MALTVLDQRLTLLGVAAVFAVSAAIVAGSPLRAVRALADPNIVP